MVRVKKPGRGTFANNENCNEMGIKRYSIQLFKTNKYTIQIGSFKLMQHLFGNYCNFTCMHSIFLIKVIFKAKTKLETKIFQKISKTH